MILAVSDAVVNGLYLALTGLLIAGTQLLTSRLAANKVAAVKVALENTAASTTIALEKIEKTGEKTHTLVNSQMGGVLKLVDDLSRWKANREPTPENIKAAELAEQMLKDHEGKQAKVDAKEAE